MSVDIDGRAAVLSGRCEAEEAETLLTALVEGLDRVDVTGCEHLHAAILQLLLASGVEVVGTPSAFVGRWLMPLLDPTANPIVSAVKD